MVFSEFLPILYSKILNVYKLLQKSYSPYIFHEVWENRRNRTKGIQNMEI